jgi:hypothetical protein
VPAAAQAPVPVAAHASDVRSLDTKAPSEAASAAQPSPPSGVAKLATDEICKHDEDRLQWLSNNPTSDEAMRFLAELRCEKLRPEIFRLNGTFGLPRSQRHHCYSKSFSEGRSSGGSKSASD